MTRIVVAVVLALATLSTACGLWSGLPQTDAGKTEAITVGMEPTAVNSLIYLAQNQGYFAANGLDVTIKEYPSGLAATNGMLAGEADIATASEFVVVGKALANERIRTFGTIDKFLHIYLLGRKDRGIAGASDLKGKRIGVPLKTAAEFFLGRFLDLHGLSLTQVTLVDVNPTKAAEVLVAGDVDAVIAWRPNVNAIEERLGNGVVEWRAQMEQVVYCALVATDDWAARNPAVIRRFLSALVQAESYNLGHPDEAREIVQRQLRYDDAYMATVWPEHYLSVALDQSLILAMEDQARWMVKNRLTSAEKTPDFLKYVEVGGLAAVRPGSVNVIR